MRLIINIKDSTKAFHLIKFLKDIPFIEIEENIDNPVNSPDLKDLFGIWKDSDITIEKIREKAWSR